jgi:hypothetical protein
LYLGKVIEVKYERLYFKGMIGYAAKIEETGSGYSRLKVYQDRRRCWGVTDSYVPDTSLARKIRILPLEEEIIWKIQNNWDKTWGV